MEDGKPIDIKALNDSIRVLKDIIVWCRIQEKSNISLFDLMNMVDNAEKLKLEKKNTDNNEKKSKTK